MNTERFPTVKLYLRFYGDSFDPDEITRRLGIKPTLKFRPGDPITEDGQGRRRRYGWMIKVGGQQTIEIDTLLQAFRERVEVSAETVRKLCDDLNVEAVVLCGVGQHEDAITTPALNFPAPFLKWVAEMGASLDVDFVL
jgi:hypothetical protein